MADDHIPEVAFMADSPTTWLETPGLAVRQSFTLGLTINPKKSTGEQAFVQRVDDAGNNLIWLGFFNGQLVLRLADSSLTLDRAFTGWRRLTVSVTGKSDGSSRVTYTRNDDSPNVVACSSSLPNEIQKQAWRLGHSFRGEMRDLYFGDNVYDAQAVSERKTSLTLTGSGTVARKYKFEERGFKSNRGFK